MKRIPSWVAVLPSLVVPVCLGMSLYLGLQYLIDTKSIADEMALRYLIGHPVSRITVAMFLIGISSLLMIGWNLIQQYSSEKDITLGEFDLDDDSSATVSDPREMAVDHGQVMLDLPNRLHGHYLWERLVSAVHSIYRTGSTSNVEEELKYLSDIDQERQQQRYSLVRILIWATPMLGFLGTVLGISQALGGIAVGPNNDFQQMMDGLRGNLYIAFDTTALALTLSMAMMFGQFLIERFESQLLRLVDQRARSEISRHYELTAAGTGAGSQEIVEAIQNVVANQTEIWRDSIRMAEQAWTASLTQTSEVVRTNLTESLDENIASLAHYLGEAIEKADQSISQRWSQWQVCLSENARLMEKHMVMLSKQTESVERIVGTLDDSTAFESALQHQQDAVMATARTHRVLNELLVKVEEAGMVPEPGSLAAQQSVIADETFEKLRISEMKAAAEQIAAEEAAAEELRLAANLDLARQDDDALVVAPPVIDAVAEEQRESLIRIYDEDVEGVECVEGDAVEKVEVSEEVEAASKPEPESTPTPFPVTPVNQSNSARIARALAGDSPAAPEVRFSIPPNRVRRSDESQDGSNGNRKAA